MLYSYSPPVMNPVLLAANRIEKSYCDDVMIVFYRLVLHYVLYQIKLNTMQIHLF